MVTLKCKMCGGSLEIDEKALICECEYCGSKQTVPKLDTDRKISLYDRADHFRRNTDFDKAMAIYEQILDEDRSDAEAYWSIVLCRYGIEYVEDPATKKRIPTVNRAQYTSIFADEDYKEAIANASPEQRIIFEEEAKTIDEIQKGILEISRKEEPFDVFICYKETDKNGNRTKDSVIANDLYYQLTREGFKVFFAAITLEDKLGKAYEPYIFAALNSAKVMIVLGTKPEYFTAPWVKNEWSRYLTIIKNNPDKTIIPAYRDMDAYDLPEEFSFLQAQDMSKIGFTNDLIRGIRKLINKDKEQTGSGSMQQAANLNVLSSGTGKESLIKRAGFFLEDGDWSSANLYCEKVLDIDPECAEAYVIRLLTELQAKSIEELGEKREIFDQKESYIRACKYADADIKAKLNQCDYNVKNRKLAEFKNEFEQLGSENECGILEKKFRVLSGFEDADEYINKCRARAKDFHNEMLYRSACQINAEGDTAADLKKAKEIFKQIEDYKDSQKYLAELDGRIFGLNQNDTRCPICLETTGTRTFVGGNTPQKCCEDCFKKLNFLLSGRGNRSLGVKNVYVFFEEKLKMMTRDPAIDKVKQVMKLYSDSVPGFIEVPHENTENKINGREKTQYEIEEERIREEEKQKEIFEKQKEVVQKQKNLILQKNAMYEYDLEVIADKSTGIPDTEMIRYLLDKKASEGWRLHTVISAKITENSAIGQTQLYFERKIKKEE